MVPLPRLRRIDISDNALSTLAPLAGCPQLTQLVAEGNVLKTLVGLEHVTNLLELYVANNQLAVVRDLRNVRGAPRLIIADFAGNPVTQKEYREFRLYTIFHFSKLKVRGGGEMLE